MTDQSNPPANPPGDPGQTPISDKPFYDAWGDDLKASATIVNAKSAEDVARMYLNAEKRLGVPANRLLVVPDKVDDAEGWGKIHAALGRPDTVEGYQVQLGENASDADKAFVDKFLGEAHKAGASPAVVAAAIGVLNEATAQARTDAEAADKAAAEATRAALDKAWGDKAKVYDSEIPALLTQLGEELDKTLPEGARLGDVVEKLNAEGMGNSPTLLRLLAHLADSRAEPGLPGGGKGGADRGMTPDQAGAARRALEADPVKGLALRDRTHSLNKDVLAERNRLLAIETGKA
ncbi:hypothetical protein [Caulobacter hibisci]|uniref:Uncharacterized protein n=1 Tax=Caulobacter hibisci TaxID=2035993 RepID=A0ABS0T0R4_9CAUL|nr:hypothetical protein [Caulobacter hibisci]MBI1684457.1 hypothetical protein [Caulobacter hibisci]